MHFQEGLSVRMFPDLIEDGRTTLKVRSVIPQAGAPDWIKREKEKPH